MTALLRMLSCEGWMNLAVALLHTLWQAALLAGGLYLLLRVLPARRANLRYAAALAALLGVLAGGLITWKVLQAGQVSVAASESPRMATGPGQAGSGGPEAAEAPSVPAPEAGERSVPDSGRPRPGRLEAPPVRWSGWLLGAWLIGVVVVLLRAILSVCGAARLRRQAAPLDEPGARAVVQQLQRALRLGRRVRTEDKAPLPKRTSLMIYSKSQRHGAHK